jgi:hypothetical protein
VPPRRTVASVMGPPSSVEPVETTDAVRPRPPSCSTDEVRGLDKLDR